MWWEHNAFPSKTTDKQQVEKEIRQELDEFTFDVEPDEE